MLLRACLYCLLSILAATAQAQTLLTRDEQDFIHFGFAAQLGSGIYAMSGRTIQVYRLPFAIRFPTDDESRIGVRLTLPVTIGLVDFEPQDVLGTDLPESLDSVSFVPGIALDIALRDDWVVEPFVEAGVARDRTAELDERVYSAGMRSRFDFGQRGTDWQLYNELVHVAVEQKSPDRTDDLTRFRTGISGRRSFDAERVGRRADFVTYGFVDLLLDPPDGPVNGEPGDDGGPAQIEVGMTFGATEPIHLWKIPLPRIGLGYRFGADLEAYRLVFGAPF